MNEDNPYARHIHTRTELRALNKATLIDALLRCEAQLAESERECWELRYQHDFPPVAPIEGTPMRRAERFMLATAKGLALSYRNVDTTIPAVSRAVINQLRESVWQYNEAKGAALAARGEGSDG